MTSLNFPRYNGRGVENLTGVFDVDTNILSLSWTAPEVTIPLAPPISYIILVKEGGLQNMTPTSTLSSWGGYYSMTFLAEVNGSETTFETDFTTEINKKWAIGVYPVYYKDLLSPISGSGLLTLIELDTFTGGDLTNKIVLPRGLTVDSESNLYFNNGFLRDVLESPPYYITTKVTPQNVATGVEDDMDNLTTGVTERPVTSVYNEKLNSVFNEVGSATNSKIFEYKIDTDTYVEYASTGGPNNQKLMYFNTIVGVDNETGFVYVSNSEQGTNRFRGIWELRPELSLSGFMTSQGGTTEILNATDVKFNNTVYQNDIILGQLLHSFISFSPTNTSATGAAVVIAKDSTSFTVRWQSSASTNLQWVKRSNYIAVNINGGESSTKWYELANVQNATQGYVYDGHLYYTLSGVVYKTNLTTKERTTVGTLAGALAVTVTPDDTVYVATASAVYRLDEFGAFNLFVGQNTVSTTPVNGEGNAGSFAGIRGMVYSPDGYIYVTDYHTTTNSTGTSAIRRISVSEDDETVGIVGNKTAEVDNDDTTDNYESDGEVSTDPDLTGDQELGIGDWTVEVPEDPKAPLSFTDPNSGLIQLIPITGRQPGDVITVRKNNGMLVILRNGKIVYTYLLSPLELKLLPSTVYIGWYQPGTKTPISTPPEFINTLPLNGYKYILQTAFTERMYSREEPFMFGNRRYGKGFLLFNDDSYVYDRALLDDDINRAVYKILGGRKYYYNATEYLESPILPEWLVAFLAVTPLRDNLIEVTI